MNGLKKLDGPAAVLVLDEVTDLYMEAYATGPYDQSDSVHSRQAFIDRTTAQASAPGFAMVISRDDDGDLAGMSFGLPFGAGRWWRDVSGHKPDEALVKPDKFAVIELAVSPRHQGRGLSGALIDALLSDRTEPFAMLLADPQAPAHKIYEGWGWRVAGKVQTASDSAVDDVMTLALR